MSDILFRILLWPLEWVLEAVFLPTGPLGKRFARWIAAPAQFERFAGAIRIVEGRQPGFTVGWRAGIATIRRDAIEFEDRKLRITGIDDGSRRPSERDRAPIAGPCGILRIRTATAELEWAIAEDQVDLVRQRLRPRPRPRPRP
ncbi:hypothetical protein ACDF64_17455 [Agromyces sp. MMS24-JH15]|uniref:hypothetical protein n=1 Tax=Agromyces sp. MMS24-JH15 TaxID=3243765 RepID=UPI00374A48ED